MPVVFFGFQPVCWRQFGAELLIWPPLCRGAEPRKKAKAAESQTSKVAETVARLEKRIKEAKEKAVNDVAKAAKKAEETELKAAAKAANDAAKATKNHCEACNASFKSSKALKGHEQSVKHQDNFDPEGAEPRKKARADEAQARLATPEGKAAAEKKKAAAEKRVADKLAQAATPEGKAAAEKKARGSLSPSAAKRSRRGTAISAPML
jgi:hypothetical protein